MLEIGSAHELAEARAEARRVCASAGRVRREDVTDDVLLVLSELVGNAQRHGRPPVGCEVRLDGEDLLVAVEDEDPRPLPATPVQADASAESGRGLALVQALARRWGWHPTRAGKCVWARL